MSGNQRLAEEMRRLMEMYDRLCMVSLANKRGGSFDEPLADHVAISEALQRRDGAAAARRLERHVGRSRNSLMRGLGQRPIIG
jgi:DNA-binding GntR family transcriptional regulator